MPQPDTFWGLVAARAADAAEVPVVIDGDTGRTLTFGELHDRAERVAAGLASVGIEPGQVVSWQLPTAVDTVVVTMALARLGAVQNPIIAGYGNREVRAVVRQARSHWLLVPDTEAGTAETATGSLDDAPRVVALAEPLPVGDPASLPPPLAPEPHATGWIYCTSGTTAEPKAVLHSDATLLAGAAAFADTVAMTTEDVGSIAFPFAHIGGADYLGALLLTGARAVLLGAFVPELAVAAFRRHGVTIAGGTTAFYTALLAEHRRHPDEPFVPTLRVLAGGGAPKPPEVFVQVRRELGIRILHGWALTEVPMAACGRWDDTDEQLADTEGGPVLGAEIKVAADGELCVRGPMVCLGYADEQQTAAAFDDDGFFRTGDLGELRADGHVVVTGRRKDIIIRKGENVSALEVEHVLYEHPAVAAVAVIGLADPERGERVCAVVEPEPGQPPLTFAGMQDHCRTAGLMVQKIPEQLELIDRLPRNETMKVRKEDLRERFGTARRTGPSAR